MRFGCTSLRETADILAIIVCNSSSVDQLDAGRRPIVSNPLCRLLVKRCHYDLRKYFFSNRIINIWNSLPDSIVMVDTVNQFKNRLDKYWKNYDFV